MEPEPISIATTADGRAVVFSREERERHVYIVGKSGSGKSTLLFNLAMSDISAGRGDRSHRSARRSTTPSACPAR